MQPGKGGDAKLALALYLVNQLMGEGGVITSVGPTCALKVSQEVKLR